MSRAATDRDSDRGAMGPRRTTADTANEAARRAGRGRLLAGLGGLAVGVGLCLGACRQTPERIFGEPHDPVVWPAPPEAARIRFVGCLRSSADLNAPRGLLAGIGDVLFGAEEPGELYGPRSAVCTADGDRLWVGDPGGRCLHRFDLRDRSYAKITRMGGAPLLSPVGLCRGPGDSLFVCDSEQGAVYQCSADTGELIHALILPEAGARPVAAYCDRATGELFVVDIAAHDVKVLDAEGDVSRVLGRRGEEPGEFNYPCDIKGQGDMLWIADAGNHRVQGITRSGQPVVAFGRAGDAPGDLALPKGIALDTDGHVYVVDARFENVQVFDAAGRLLLFFGGEGDGPGEFWLPAGIYIDERDRIWICDSYNRRVQVFDYLRQGDVHGSQEE
ncbi:MAG: 6-bladed beta-propeller [Planctomycetota bacterium]